ncbi:MAG: DNA internalization-related competence protein ComEC/Rec2 [Legionellaceae bacterium]|nr:DNA internalization-related competence protein ComEC/Rec2 [Legionellaceae bacterium]
MEILCFFTGVACFYFKNSSILGILGIFLLFRPRWLLVVLFVLGFVWAACHQAYIASHAMPKEPVLKHVVLKGVIASIPVKTSDKTQFEFKLLTLNHQPVRARVLLSCYKFCPNVVAGQIWQLQAKIKKPQNLGNPGGFDFVRSLKARHIEWVGYSKQNSFKYLGQTHAIKQRLLEVRQHVSTHLSSRTLGTKTAGILQALTVGLGSQINQETWALFRRTGTTHLMVISGAHIGLVAGLTFGFLRWISSRLGWLPLIIPAQRIASVGALFVAFAYSVLAGFGVPAQRALVVCFFMLLRHMGGPCFTVWQAWRYALLSVILFEPHSVMMPGFYLSFGAVAILVSMNQLIAKHHHRMIKTLYLQLACLLGLMPLTLYLFSYGSLNGFFANLLAIPWVGFVMIPLSLLAVCLEPIIPASWASMILKPVVHVLLLYLHWIDGFSAINFNLSFVSLIMPLSMLLGFILFFIFPRVRFLLLSMILMLPGVFPKHEKIRWGEAHINILDVGQGLSVVVQTAQHNLIYDTGMKFYRGGDMGTLALIPYLKTLGVKALDAVVISHPDLDHRGGLASLEQAFMIQNLIVDDPDFYHRGSSCHDHPSWVWDGITFEFFPMPQASRSKNNHSCILQVKNNTGQVLLTGDVERRGERYLVKRYAEALKSSILLVPHHGSKTSSSELFLKQVAPVAAIASYGFDNRYHFPHAKAMTAYEKQHIPVYSTESCGLIRVDLKYGRLPKQPFCTKYHK